jgi:hypothetical protein
MIPARDAEAFSVALAGDLDTSPVVQVSGVAVTIDAVE